MTLITTAKRPRATANGEKDEEGVPHDEADHEKNHGQACRDAVDAHPEGSLL
jgi:hypothetical protein